MKNYKKHITIVSNCCLLLLVALAFCASDTFAQKKVDISCRPALYFGNNVLGAQPLNSNSRMVTAGGKLVLTPADSFKNPQVNDPKGVWYFHILYIVYGSPAKEAVGLGDFTNRLRIGSKILSQHTVKFLETDDGALDTKIRYIRTDIILPTGTSVITLSLDDDKKVAEGNENNNSYTFTVEINQKP